MNEPRSRLDLDAGLPRVPGWVTLLDALTLAALAVLVSQIAFGGFRLRVGDARLTAESVPRVVVLLALLAGLRHWRWRRPTLPARVASCVRGAWASPVRQVVLPAFLWSRLTVLAVGFLGVVLIGYPDPAPPFRISRNELVNLPLRWDAGWYLGIALDGYHYRRNAPPTQQQNIAFFPAYPMSVRVVAAWLGARSLRPGEAVDGNRVEWQYALHRRVVLAGMLVSLGAFAWALVYLFRLARELVDDDGAAGAVLAACAWPTALFFSAMYTEALFLLAMVGSWYHLRRGDVGPASGWGLLAGLARPNGFLLSLPLALLLLADWRALRAGGPGVVRRLLPKLVAAATPGLGMLLFSGYLWSTTGHPLVWMEAHQAWGRVATDVSGMITDRASFIAREGVYSYSISQPIELLNAVPALLALAAAIPVARRFGLAYAVLLVVMVVPPLLRGGFLSLGRLTSTLFPLFLYLGWRLRGSTRTAVLVACGALQALLAILFFTWRPYY
jgi:hypothetical protein